MLHGIETAFLVLYDNGKRGARVWAANSTGALGARSLGVSEGLETAQSRTTRATSEGIPDNLIVKVHFLASCLSNLSNPCSALCSFRPR